MKNLFIFLIIIVSFISSCKVKESTEKVVNKYDNTTIQVGSEHLSMATIWFQKSAENRAIYYQTFAFAQLMLDKNLSEARSNKPKAIITDIDETVLDNSAYNASLIQKGTEFENDSWAIWVNEKRAKALPGALEFCNYAKEKGVDIFYVSNRSADQTDATIENLKNEGFPYANKEHLFLKTGSSDKSDRRNKISEKYEIILLLGDNLRDFDEIFGSRGNDFGFKAVGENKSTFGTKFIVFPNPMYGEWEKAIYKNNFNRSAEEKRKMRLDALDK